LLSLTNFARTLALQREFEGGFAALECLFLLRPAAKLRAATES
jgi:hypothetical protein